MFKKILYFLFFLHCLFSTATAFAQGSATEPSNSPSTIHSTSDAACISCHSDDEPHEGVFGQNCSRCHSTKDWDQLEFDHGLSQFPLIGLHSDVDCESCHFEEPAKIKVRSCQNCHLEDEPHNQKLSQNCARCHNPNGWEYWQFDHNTQTAFPLEGAHLNLDCTACHTTPVNAEFDISQNCVACHRKDEQHRGEFGLRCERCHQPTTFKDVKVSD